MSTPAARSCATCGTELAAFSIDGFCPACLLERGLSSHGRDITPPVSRFGDYELLEEIARGGMGVVYKARQVSLGRIVAVKMILSGQFASAAEMQRFRAEARATAALQHSGIVAIHEVGEHDGLLYFSMDFIEGKNLAQLLRDGPWPAARVAQCVRDVAEAVHYAHEHGVLHRDLKPSNVLIDANGKPRLTDFGLAKRLTDSNGKTQGAEITVSGQVLGSPNFMPPEQAAGRHRALSPASDVYSLGALVYHMLTGRPPFLADNVPATLRLVAETEPAAPRLLAPNLPRDLETICLKCLEKDPQRRYATAAELIDELGRFLRDEPICARPLGSWGRLHRWTRRHPIVAGLAGTVGALLIVVALISTVGAAKLRRANREGQERLREAYLAQARANRWSGRPGQRFDSLETVRKAAAIRPGLDLRNEAIAAQALVDLREVRQWKISNGDTMVFDRRYERYARFDTNGTIVVARTRDDSELFQIAGFGLTILDIGFSPDGRHLAAHYRRENTYAFRVYDLAERGKAILDVPDRWLRTFRFLPNHRWLAIAWATWAGAKSTVTLSFHDLVTGQELHSIPLENLPYGMAISPDSSRVAVGSPESSSVYVYSIADGHKLETLTHSNGVYGVDWSQDGRRVAAACADRNVYVWDFTKSPPAATLLPHDGETITCHFTQRGDLLLSWGWNLTVKVWHTESGKELLRSPADVVGLFSPDDRWINVNRHPRTPSISEFADGRECRAYPFKSPLGGTHSLVLSPDGRWMASGHRGGLCIWNLATGHQVHIAESGDTVGLRFSPDGNRLTARSGRELVSWPIRSFETNGTPSIELGPPAPLSREPPGSVQPACRMAGVANGKAYIFDSQTLRIERRVTHPQSIYAAAISPDGRHCATWALNAEGIDLWDASDGSLLTSLACGRSPCLGFSPDGRWLITGSSEEYNFWERGSWQRRHSVSRGQTGGAHGRFAFPANGSMVALAIGRGEVGLFDATTFRQLATFESPEVNNVSGLDFSADGGRLAVSTTVQSIRVWDLRLIRQQLVELKLDFDAPPLPPATTDRRPLEITFVGATRSPAPQSAAPTEHNTR